jgi:hypothetical protein
VNADRLNLRVADERWQTFVQRPEHTDPLLFERVVSCVDKYEARRAVQYDRIPKVLLTAGTGDFLLAVSRHVLSDGLACGLCFQARDAEPTCATASEGAEQAFEAPIDPSIGFVSVLTGVLLGAELLKEIVPEWHAVRLQNTVRVKTLFGAVNVQPRPKSPSGDFITDCIAF